MKPSARQLAGALRRGGRMLGIDRARYVGYGRFAMTLVDGWTVLISADDAERFRLEACRDGRLRGTMWCLASDHERFAELLVELGARTMSLAS